MTRPSGSQGRWRSNALLLPDQVHEVDRSEKAVWRRKLSRSEWLEVLQRTVPVHAEIGMGACGSARRGRDACRRSDTP